MIVPISLFLTFIQYDSPNLVVLTFIQYDSTDLVVLTFIQYVSPKSIWHIIYNEVRDDSKGTAWCDIINTRMNLSYTGPNISGILQLELYLCMNIEHLLSELKLRQGRSH
jgi:hypothetical protein